MVYDSFPQPASRIDSRVVSVGPETELSGRLHKDFEVHATPDLVLRWAFTQTVTLRSFPLKNNLLVSSIMYQMCFWDSVLMYRFKIEWFGASKYMNITENTTKLSCLVSLSI